MFESAIMKARAVISAMKTGVAGCVAGGSGYETRGVDGREWREGRRVDQLVVGAVW